MRLGPSIGRVAASLLPLVAATGCREMQSVLHPTGPDAERIAGLSWILLGGAGAILFAVMALLGIALFAPAQSRSLLTRRAFILGGGLVFPVVTLAGLLVYGLLLMRGGSAESGLDPVRISVVGERWWWRVLYHPEGTSPVESANEIRVPTGRPVELTLTTADVIHSFWVPNLAGKVDMIPGRANRLTFTAGKEGISRGQCAEYCGGAHALMSFYVVAMAPDEYGAWLSGEASPSRAPGSRQERQGEALFMSRGCPACHAIRGTPARGTIGPDLTHFGSRHSLGAGTLPNNAQAVSRWITDNQHIKPENLMPRFGIFDDDELAAVAAYLTGLR